MNELELFEAYMKKEHPFIDTVNGAYEAMWNLWQARVPEGYVVVPVETLEECLSWANCASSESWTGEQQEEIDKHYKVIEKAMIESEK